MSALRAFHLRRQLNLLHRSALLRHGASYTTATSPPSISQDDGDSPPQFSLPSEADQLEMLETFDTRYLNETLISLAAMLSTTQTALDLVPAPKPTPPITSSTSTPFPRRRPISPIPAYTSSHLKNFHAHAAGLKQGARNLSLHLEDLKTAPSKASRQEQEAQWRAEFACMTRAQKTDLAQEMALKEDGLRVQLERATAENMAVIKQVVGRLEWHDSWAERTREKEAALRKTTRPQAPARKRDDRVASRGDEADPVVQPPPQTPERLPAQADRTLSSSPTAVRQRLRRRRQMLARRQAQAGPDPIQQSIAAAPAPAVAAGSVASCGHEALLREQAMLEALMRRG